MQCVTNLPFTRYRDVQAKSLAWREHVGLSKKESHFFELCVIFSDCCSYIQQLQDRLLVLRSASPCT